MECFVLSSGPFIKGLMLFSLRGGEFPDHQAYELTPDECFNLPYPVIRKKSKKQKKSKKSVSA